MGSAAENTSLLNKMDMFLTQGKQISLLGVNKRRWDDIEHQLFEILLCEFCGPNLESCKAAAQSALRAVKNWMANERDVQKALNLIGTETPTPKRQKTNAGAKT